MPLDEKQKEYLMVGGVALAVVGILVALRKGAGSQVAGQTLAGNRAPTPGQPGYSGSAAANDLGKAYLDYQFKEQQLTAQNANFQAQLASTDARTILNAQTELEIAKLNASSKQNSQIIAGAMPLAGDVLKGFLNKPAPPSNPNADGTNNTLAPPYSKNVLDADNPNANPPYNAAADQTGHAIVGYSDANKLAVNGQVFGPPSAPATPGVGFPSINGLVGNDPYQTSPIVNWLTGQTYDVPYEDPSTVTPASQSPFNPADYFSAPGSFDPSFPGVGFDMPTQTVDMGTGGSADSGSNDVGFDGGVA